MTRKAQPNLKAYRTDMVAQTPFVRQAEDRQDADTRTLWFQRELEVQLAEVYRTKYPELKFAEGMVIPMRATLPRGAKKGSYKIVSYTGVAKYFTSGSLRDLDLAGVKSERVEYAKHTFGNAYGWDLDELEEAQFSGFPLPAESLDSARRGNAIFLNDKLAFGDETKGYFGLLNQPNMTVVDAAAGSSGAYRWSTTGGTAKTALEMHEDIAFIIRTMRGLTQRVHRPNRIWMPPSFWERTLSVVVPNTEVTARDFIQRNHPDIVFDELDELETAGNYSGPCIMAAQINSPRDLWAEVPMRDEPHGPFEDGLRTNYALRSAVGGVQTPYPLALLRLDFPAD